MTVRELMDVAESTLNIVDESKQIIFSINDAFIEYGVLSEKFLNAEVGIIEPKANAINVYIKNFGRR